MKTGVARNGITFLQRAEPALPMVAAERAAFDEFGRALVAIANGEVVMSEPEEGQDVE